MSGLVLTRLVGQETIIETPSGDKIVVALHSAESGRAQIRFEAPRAYKVNRKEVHEVKQKQRARAVR